MGVQAGLRHVDADVSMNGRFSFSFAYHPSINAIVSNRDGRKAAVTQLTHGTAQTRIHRSCRRPAPESGAGYLLRDPSQPHYQQTRILLQVEVDGPGWTDRQVADACRCRTRDVENVQRRCVASGRR